MTQDLKTLSIAQLKERANKDTELDHNKLDMYSVRLPKKLSDWNQILLDEQLFYERKEFEYNILKKKKWEHYLHNYQYAVERRGGEIDVYINSDPELIVIKEKLSISKDKLNFIEGIIRTLQGTGYQIKNYIDWQKFQNGGY
jgi:hypothetical protein